jgi:hypothetical protein
MDHVSKDNLTDEAVNFYKAIETHQVCTGSTLLQEKYNEFSQFAWSAYVAGASRNRDFNWAEINAARLLTLAALPTGASLLHQLLTAIVSSTVIQSAADWHKMVALFEGLSPEILADPSIASSFQALKLKLATAIMEIYSSSSGISSSDVSSGYFCSGNVVSLIVRKSDKRFARIDLVRVCKIVDYRCADAIRDYTANPVDMQPRVRRVKDRAMTKERVNIMKKLVRAIKSSKEQVLARLITRLERKSTRTVGTLPLLVLAGSIWAAKVSARIAALGPPPVAPYKSFVISIRKFPEIEQFMLDNNRESFILKGCFVSIADARRAEATIRSKLRDLVTTVSAACARNASIQFEKVKSSLDVYQEKLQEKAKALQRLEKLIGLAKAFIANRKAARQPSKVLRTSTSATSSPASSPSSSSASASLSTTGSSTSVRTQVPSGSASVPATSSSSSATASDLTSTSFRPTIETSTTASASVPFLSFRH